MLAVGIGSEINEEELRGIASTPDNVTNQTVFMVGDFKDLAQILKNLVHQSCVPLPVIIPDTSTTSTTTTTTTTIATTAVPAQSDYFEINIVIVMIVMVILSNFRLTDGLS